MSVPGCFRLPIERTTPTQWVFIQSPAWIRCIVGGYGSGKTTAAALAFISNCFKNPWRPEYASDHPSSIVVGLTWGVVRDSSYKAIKNLLPPEAIRREWKAERKILLQNGHEILFKTAKGKLEGQSACTLWLDEAHQLPPAQWPNYQSRVRDPRARAKLIVVSGLPESGWLQETFDAPHHRADPTRCMVFAATTENHALDPAVLAQLRSSIGHSDAEALLGGKWRTPKDAVYYEFDASRNIIDEPGDRRAQTHLTIDVGNRAAILFFQKINRRVRDQRGNVRDALGLHFMDELLPEEMSTEAACRLAKARGWRLDADSEVYVDPRTNIDQKDAIRRVFGLKTVIICKQRGQVGYDVAEGHRAVNAAMRDADGNVRLTFWRGLPHDKRSLLTGIPKLRMKPDGSGYVKDQMTDHAAGDSLRYPVAHLLPLREMRVLVSDRAA